MSVFNIVEYQAGQRNPIGRGFRKNSQGQLSPASAETSGKDTQPRHNSTTLNALVDLDRLSR
ncbi:hypothetical protein SNOG_03253 [Parastagonospora nodorum SN15]|uniref:Uncharacterized protein n=1 Tax=Phaeosphaeria nodorum (strain SN15 / ATCC MYA-4574 / FGSC 10173) TaxID=321614 RepID=Q0UYB1_PHANO|nr:hypothetical protein SNOG_03253 [Parastagonospora nodorum SN15]EAT89984.1 hypothetical protein SNOG_03253 [Parastagonospora nodorum SN15]